MDRQLDESGIFRSAIVVHADAHTAARILPGVHRHAQRSESDIRYNAERATRHLLYAGSRRVQRIAAGADSNRLAVALAFTIGRAELPGNQHSNVSANADPHVESDPRAGSDRKPYFHANAKPNGDADDRTDPDTDCYARWCDSNADPRTDRNTHCKADPDTHADSNTYPNAGTTHARRRRL